MRKKLCIAGLLIAWSSLPLLSRAQSQQSNNVVSVRELSIPPKALRAFEQGVELLSKKDSLGSLPHFQRAIAEFAGYYEAYHAMGTADLKLWRIADADNAFRKAIDLSGGQYSPAQRALAAVLDYQGKFAEAEGVARAGLSLEPNSWSGHYYLGWALFGLNRLEGAEKSVREALRQKEDSIEAWRLLADIHGRERDYSALVNDLNEYLKLDPNSPTGVRAKALRDTAQRILYQGQDTAALAPIEP